MAIPTTMQAWQLTPGTKMEKTFKLNPSVPLPVRKPDMHLIKVNKTALNPVDYKPVEIPYVTRLVLPNPATPVLDFCGEVVQPADGSDVKPGDMVFGNAGVHLLGGALAQYTVAKKDHVAILPAGLDPKTACTVNVAGLTAYQSIQPHVKEGSNVFINGGSGGTGIFGIQIAKTLGCYVTTTCSTPNVDLCKSLGADEVIDYKKQNVIDALKASGRQYDHVVDNVGHDYSLFWRAHEYTTPKALYMTIGAKISWGFVFEAIAARVWPAFLGGSKRKAQGFQAVAHSKDLEQVGKWMSEGRVKPIFDSEFSFDSAPQAFERLKTGRAKGKIIVDVESKAVST